MDLPTYTNIWRIEKRLYKLYDLRLPMPLPIVWIGVFVGVFVPWSLLLVLVGVPVQMPWHVLFLVPPGIVTWLSTRPVIEGKRLTELLESQLRYLGQPRAWYRLAPSSEPETITFSGRVWHTSPAPVRVKKSRKARAAQEEKQLEKQARKQSRRQADRAAGPRQVRPAVAAAAAAAVQAPLTEPATGRALGAARRRGTAPALGSADLAPQAPPRPAERVSGARDETPSLRWGELPLVSAHGAQPQEGLPLREDAGDPGPAGRRSAGAATEGETHAGDVGPAGATAAAVPGADEVQGVRETPGEARTGAGKPIDTEALRRLRRLAASAEAAPPATHPEIPPPAAPHGPVAEPPAVPGSPVASGSGVVSEPHTASESPVVSESSVVSEPSAARSESSSRGAQRAGGPQPAATSHESPAAAAERAPASTAGQSELPPAVTRHAPEPPPPMTLPAVSAASLPADDVAAPGPSVPTEGASQEGCEVAGDGREADATTVPPDSAEWARMQHRKGQPPRQSPSPVPGTEQVWPPLGPGSKPVRLTPPASERADDETSTPAATTTRPDEPGVQPGVRPGGARQDERGVQGGGERRAADAAATAASAPRAAEGGADGQDTRQQPAEAAQQAEPAQQAEAAQRVEASQEVAAAQPVEAAQRGATSRRVEASPLVESDSSQAAEVRPQPQEARPRPVEVRAQTSERRPQTVAAPAESAERRPQTAEARNQMAEARQTTETRSQTSEPRPQAAEGRLQGAPVRGLPSEGRREAPGREARVRRVESVVGRDSGGWRRIAQVVVGGGGVRTDGSEIDEARARGVFGGSRRIVVLGCTGGAGQSTTALMLGHTLARHRDDKVIAVDASSGRQTLTSRITPETPETLTSLLSGLDRVSGYLSMRGYTSRTPSGLEVIGADADADAERRLADRTLLSDHRLGQVMHLLDRHYKLAVVDPAAALAARVLPYADQLVLVVPASEEASEAVAMTYEWLDGHGCADLRRRAVMVVNGVSRRSMADVEQAEAVARGRCRAIVRVPWEDDLAPGGAEVVEPGQLRAAGRRAYLALAGVVVAGFAAQTVRPSEEEMASDPPGTRIGER